MSSARKVCAVAVLAALAWAGVPVAEAQPSIRIGASLSQTGSFANLGQNRLRAYQLCIKDTNQWQDGRKAIVWPEELAPGKPRFPTPPWSQR